MSLSKFHLAPVDVGPTLALRCLSNANYISQRYNGLLTLAQRSHAVWEYANTEKVSTKHVYSVYFSCSSLSKTTKKPPKFTAALTTYTPVMPQLFPFVPTTVINPKFTNFRIFQGSTLARFDSTVQ